MKTPVRERSSGGRYAKFYDAADDAELGSDDDDEDRDYHDSAEDSAKAVIKRLSFDNTDSDRAQYLEYRQLPKKTQRKWSLLIEAFLDYYCSQFDQSARTHYYSARRKENEPVCDFLIRLKGYAKSAKIQYESKGPDAADHVEHFLLNCRDDDIMDLLYPQQLDDIKKVEKIINQKILGESGRSSGTGS
ncbi:uncharacterized protein IUM83_07447 [Phytophthora cinnamomi]|uniref:uncharacterized protein n=1 Tax=Phytophthora cinnamomi TaxID=4785 RepID=UPI0035595422|nr:hypothetical protein IUM83_07447 [Phytophthora cinnamomi]